MGKVNARLEAARKRYRETLDAARSKPSPEAWARLLAAGKDLSAAEEPKHSRSGRKSRSTATPTYRELEDESVSEASAPVDAPELSDALEPLEPSDAPDPEHHELEHAE